MLFSAILDFATILMTFLMIFGIFLIIIILLQKGRGGGLAGAFGGAGGQSALGTKAGDVFTKITVVMAVIWVILAGVSGIATRASSGKYAGGNDAVTAGASATDDAADSPILEDDKPAETEFKKPGELSETPAKPETATKEETKPAKPSDTPAPAETKQDAPVKPETEKPAETKSEPKSN